jgi:hypothetical protein
VDKILLFEVTINPNTITRRAERIVEKESTTNVVIKSKPIENIRFRSSCGQRIAQAMIRKHANRADARLCRCRSKRPQAGRLKLKNSNTILIYTTDRRFSKV